MDKIGKVLLFITALAAVVASSVFVYDTMKANQREQAKARAVKECSDKIGDGPGFDLGNEYSYNEYNKCMASKGFDEFKR